MSDTKKEKILLHQFDASYVEAQEALENENYKIFDNDKKQAQLSGAWAGFLHDVLEAAITRRDADPENATRPLDHLKYVIDTLATSVKDGKINTRSLIKKLSQDDRNLLSGAFSEFRIDENPMHSLEAIDRQARFGPNGKFTKRAFAVAAAGTALIGGGWAVKENAPDIADSITAITDSRHTSDDWAASSTTEKRHAISTDTINNTGNALIALGGLAALAASIVGVLRYTYNWDEDKETVAEVNNMMKQFIGLMADTQIVSEPQRAQQP